jgi:methylornithine synthase
MKMNRDDKDKLDKILNNSLEGRIPSEAELAYIAKLNDIDAINALFSTAREICRKNFGNKVFAYGFLYVSTYCRNTCKFCRYNASNRDTDRYRRTIEEILEGAILLKKEGVHLIDITTGEDPYIYYNPKGLNYLLDAISTIKENIGLPIMCSPGAVPLEWLDKIKKAGASWLALYQETYNRKLFEKIKPNQDFEYRLKVKERARNIGLLIEDGMLLGIGETIDDCIEGIYMMKKLGANQVREMGFVPFEGASIQNSPPLLYEMKVIALMRIVHQDKLIPASYDIDGLKGLQLRLMVGANVVTSFIPNTKFLGVANPYLGLNEKRRCVEHLKPYLSEIGLKFAHLNDYLEWIERESAKNNLEA